MSTITISDISLEADSPAHRLRRTAAAVRVHVTWWGVHKALRGAQKEEVGLAYDADTRLVTAGKKLVDTRHEAFRRLTAVRTRLGNYWRGATLSYTEPGVRLIRQADIEAFVHALEGFRDELTEAEGDLNAVYGQVKEDARQRLGRLYDPADYPPEVRGLFALEWDFPAVEPPAYLMRLNPELYQQEQERVSRRFEEAVMLAEQAFAGEFAKLLTHLAERLGGEQDGRPKVFRDSALGNLAEFFARFRDLNIRSNPELDHLVEQAQQLVQGVTPQALRDNTGLRQVVAAEMAQVRTEVEALLVDRPRRRLVRPVSSTNGEAHAPAN
jgi:hypothetical protein